MGMFSEMQNDSNEIREAAEHLAMYVKMTGNNENYLLSNVWWKLTKVYNSVAGKSSAEIANVNANIAIEIRDYLKPIFDPTKDQSDEYLIRELKSENERLKAKLHAYEQERK